MPTIRGDTNNPEEFAVFGNHTSPVNVSGPAGSGVFGLTIARNGAGVFGANNSPQGVGVQGNGPTAGVSGFSAVGIGIRGLSQHTGLHAQGPRRAAVFVGRVEVNGIDLEATLQEIELRIHAAEIRSLGGPQGPVIKRF